MRGPRRTSSPRRPVWPCGLDAAASADALVLEEGDKLRTGLVGRLLRGVVTARQHPAANIASSFQPGLDRPVAAVDVAALAPEHQHGNIELVLQIRLVV